MAFVSMNDVTGFDSQRHIRDIPELLACFFMNISDVFKIKTLKASFFGIINSMQILNGDLFFRRGQNQLNAHWVCLNLVTEIRD
jgi:hypothetical protein